MIPCQNCGKLNSEETNFCRFCGTKYVYRQPLVSDPYDYSPPRPYAWQTDEFQTQNEARKTLSSEPAQMPNDRLNLASHIPQPGPLAYQKDHFMARPFRCPHCMSQYPPRVERRISTGGWITFAVLLVVFFPLFWIGLLIKEDVRVCQSCNSKVD